MTAVTYVLAIGLPVSCVVLAAITTWLIDRCAKRRDARAEAKRRHPVGKAGNAIRVDGVDRSWFSASTAINSTRPLGSGSPIDMSEFEFEWSDDEIFVQNVECRADFQDLDERYRP